jgi:hypothetical protein
MEKIDELPTLARYLLFKDSLAYGWHRLRYFLGTSLFKVVIFWIDLIFIFPLLPSHLFIEAFILKSVLYGLERFWWGGTEQMRTYIRENRMNKKRITRSILGWMALSIVPSTALLFLATFWLWQNGLTPFSAYTWVLMATTATNIPLRTFHSGVFALSRIRRPLWSQWLTPVTLLLFVWATLPSLQGLSWPIGLALSSLFRVCLTAYFVLAQYKRLSLWPLKTLSFSLPLRSIFEKNFWASGLSYAFIHLNQWIAITTLFFSLSPDALNHPFTILLYPLFHIGAEWTQLFYFDFQKTLFSPFLFNWSIRKLALKTAFAVSFCSLALVYIFTYPIRETSHLLLLTLLFTWQAFLSIQELHLYMNRKYLQLSCCHIICGVGSFLWLEQLVPGEIFSVFIALGTALAYWNPSFMGAYTRIIGFFDFLYAVSIHRSQCRLGCVRLTPNASSFQQRAIAESLAQILARSGAVSYHGLQKIFWLESKKEAPLAQSQICSIGGGLIEEILLYQWKESGKEALKEAFPITKSPPNFESVKKQFEKRVPESQGSLLSRKISHRIATKGYEYLRFLQPANPLNKREYIALFHPAEGEPLLFSLCTRKKSGAAQEWKALIFEWNQSFYVEGLLREKR